MATATPNFRGYGSAINQSHSGTAQSILLKFFNERIGRQRKPWALLCEWLGVDEHTAKHRLHGRRDYSPDDIVAALRGDLGGELLERIMGDADPAWYRQFRRQRQLGAIRRDIARQQKMLERLELDAAE